MEFLRCSRTTRALWTFHAARFIRWFLTNIFNLWAIFKLVLNVNEFLGIVPNNVQRRVFIAALVFGGTFMLDGILIVSFGLINKGLKFMSLFVNYTPFSSERIVMFVLILSVGVFLSLIYYVVLPINPPPKIKEVSGEYANFWKVF